jgi:hypothetical protein
LWSQLCSRLYKGLVIVELAALFTAGNGGAALKDSLTFSVQGKVCTQTPNHPAPHLFDGWYSRLC